tara:strand:- start:440 stop:1375 length:936 start_codon:yes stop_codon:yes gene_type:complete
MPLAVTVEASETFPSNQAVTLSKLRKASKPNVAITGSVGATDLENNAVSNANVASDAGIDISKLAGQTEDNIILVSDTSDGSGKKLITSAPPDGNAAIELSSGKAKITPSDETITGAKLDDKASDNLIAHLVTTTSVDAEDYVMVHDSSITGDANVKLKKVTVNNIQAVGTTAYSLTAITPTADSSIAGNNDFKAEIDLDGTAFQTLDVTAGKYYNIYIKTGTYPTSGNKVKTVSVKIKNTSSSTSANGTSNFGQSTNSGASKWPAGWIWPERASNIGPASITGTETGILSVTAFGPNPSDVVAAWIVSVP